MAASEWSPAHCPLCGAPNRCAMEVARETGAQPAPCWCAGVDFSADLLARVPAGAVRVACICESCARLGGNTPETVRRGQ